MSTSNTHQQSLADAGSETRPPMLERGPYEFKEFTSSKTEPSRMQKEEDLKRDDLKHYEAKIEAINLILIFIPNDIYNSLDACTTTQAIWQRVERLMRNCTKQEFEKLVNASRVKKLEKSYDPLALVAHTSSSFRTISLYYVTYPSSVVDYDEDYQGDTIQNTSEDPLTFAMILLTRAITQRFSNPTNNRLHTSSNTRNQAIVQADKNDTGNIQRTLRTTSSETAANVQCYNYSEKCHYARNCPKPRVQDLKYFMEQMWLAKQDKAIQPTNFDSDEGPSYDSTFLSEVETPSTS
ncbi:retrovirus-related pol polyprotein from transposon TNT 1-94 [Tanacetum coccineum]